MMCECGRTFRVRRTVNHSGYTRRSLFCPHCCLAAYSIEVVDPRKRIYKPESPLYGAALRSMLARKERENARLAGVAEGVGTEG